MASSMHLSRLRKWLLASPPVEWAVSHLQELLIGALREGPIPQHVAFIMDGNRRFAREQGIERVEGHNLGFEALAQVLEVCYKAGVKVVTIYAFSIENFKRSKYEVDALMDMAKVKLSQLSQHGDLLDRYGASIRVLGRRELVKADVLEAIDRAVELTSRNGDAILNVCFPYTSRDEITAAVRNTVIDYSTPLDRANLPGSNGRRRQFSESRIAKNIKEQSPGTAPLPSAEDVEDSADDSPSSFSSSTTLHAPENLSKTSTVTKLYTTYPPNSDQFIFLNAETITEQTLDDRMLTADCPPVDFLVRTSGVERLSDFMLWQCHENTEIVFLDTLWPSFDLWRFLPVVWDWQWRMRKQRKNRHETNGSGVDDDYESSSDSLDAGNGWDQNGEKLKTR
ncbi:di-trans,poly-cis-decaprenylcistransferase [Polytolypa hystricis UAMH7299]|uniref:Alkyl transferase n=1 Tax=Polytolypa hystricis (strain UAMH7299) TaxID=1447883 RepID=A0A2B7XNR1_POLH7|nr:di-trans,poly-cis-decaprenylcistransferase [Polytolypa hystricis UAMH7299]